MNLYFQDESRFGMFTRNGKILTSKGIKPICPYHQVFKSTYLFGSFSPLNGDNFLMEMSLCNAQTFQVYLNELSKHRPSEYKILVLDNAAFHKAKKLNIPENIGMIFLPPYSPELNPAEKVWWKFKRSFTNILCSSLNQVSDFITKTCQNLTSNEIKNICSFDYVFQYFDWTI